MDDGLQQRVEQIAASIPITDIHTHLYSPAFGASRPGDPGGDPLLLWGIDELLAYHYFVDEVFRVLPARSEPGSLGPAQFWAMPVADRADLVWQKLFVERPPVSEACVGVVDVLTALGLEPDEPDLTRYRSWFAARDIDAHIDEVMRLAGVTKLVMTNEPFTDLERSRWLENPRVADDPRFAPVVRVDPIVERWPEACRKLAAWGYGVADDLSGDTIGEVRRFLDEWIERARPEYLACSLSPGYRHEPDSDDPALHDFARLFDECLVATAREHGLMLALMIGANRGIHPEMQIAGDGLGKTDINQLVSIARTHPDVTFLVTLLSREDQHELCVTARKFANILPFGCWWYLNTTSQIREITRMRLELLGTAFIPQHSDARVLEQLIYKWRQSRRLIGECLAERYIEAERAGLSVSDAAIEADLDRLLRGNYAARISAGVH
ncbi:MAG: glucuronate isomerase [Phycisphaeraceae bacterium]|nr:MAG: glucuronate isomerase [Phycisphaeraceae bacterium]